MLQYAEIMQKVAIIGAGIMGRTLLRGLLQGGGWDPGRILVGTRRPETAEEITSQFGVRASHDSRSLVGEADFVVLCLKPKNIARIVEALSPHLAPSACFLSVAAGVTLADIAAAADPNRALIRAMPNTPCQVGAGMTVLSPGEFASTSQIEAAQQIFALLGRVLVLEEEHMNAVTGLSASGPAFLYLVIESLTDGGVMSGLPRKVAMELAAQTVMGAAQMVLETGKHPAALKDAVTTPAGCTISALLRLEDGRLRSVLARGVQEAATSAAGLRQVQENS
ncbi:MAG: pyrroline-5-carboxylate reductase [Planctomycetota bacterium]|nr:MAG: pyrroline-5-carboxylate reductase [Planctomycetota bacterium]